VLTLRHAWRSLLRSPGFVVVSVLALGLGLGLSTTMFAVLDAVVHPYLPYRDPDTLFRVHWWYSVRGATVTAGDLYRAVRDETHSFESVIPVVGARVTLETANDIRDIFVRRVPPEYWPVTGLRAELGRGFVAGDGEAAVVLSNDLWKRLFGKRRTLDSASVTLSGRTYAVVGVMPRGVEDASAWLPLPPSADPTVSFAASPLVRLKPGITKSQADAELVSLGRLMTARFSDRDRPIAFELMSIRNRREELRDLHKAMVGSALAVLIIACVNLAHLMLARGLAKRRELALRLALGASRATTVRLMFAECALIAVAGALVGAVVAFWGTDVLTNRMPPEVAWVGLVQPQLSWRVFAASAVAAMAAAVMFGLLPAIRVALAVSMDEPLKDGAGTTGRSRQRYSPLVVAEVGLALVLLMGGGLMLRSIQAVRRVQFTFDERTLLLSRIGFRDDRDSTRGMTRDGLLELVDGVPGVRAAAFSGGGFQAVGGALTGEMVGDDSTRTISTRSVPGVSWQYLRVHGLPVLQGRDFEAGDGYGPDRVAVINPVAALRLYPGQDPIGRMIKLGAPERDAPWVRIVGVFRSPVAIRGEDQTPVGPLVLVADTNRVVTFGTLLIRTASEDPQIAVAIRRKFHDLPNLWFTGVEPYAAGRDADLRSRSFLAQVFVSMGMVALALSALGLYGVLAYAVNQRMREFAVRIALGATPRQLFRMVLHDGMVMLLAGIGLGAFGALAAARMLDAVLTSVLPSDVVALVAAEAVLLGVGFLAAFAPALRAVRANPLDILRAV